ncbi:hypothetical protein HELRODRAFT_165469 [Helobdella robusta]|uniref:Endonuclease/exonuclease/phosphatase domain-containing protein n=1 Tax=Helobdella robusta TaxID=6412 RepID=T1EWV0_HELRO|nr:hypothetical protein HELRODRAFT_165469 [Helobdella robusta]ESN91435.1 hypothetical protein HELRODRAFT_165469 [Helobdella robusta]
MNKNFIEENLEESKYYTVKELSNIIKLKNKMKNNHLPIIHLNARSLFHKLLNLEIFLKQFDDFFKIIVISETWLNNETVDLIKLNNYNFVYKNRKSKRGGGVGVFIKHDIKYVVNDNSAFDDENVDVLCVDIESGHASSRGVLKVIAIYRPPNYKFEPFLNKINLILHAIKSADKTVIVGDFNVNLLDNDSNDSKDFQNLLFSFCFSPLINLPTRVTCNAYSLIDNIFTNLYQHCESGVIVSDFSDHFPVYAIVENFKTAINDDQILCRKINKTSIFFIKKALSLQNWHSVKNEKNIDTACLNFYNILNKTLDTYAPLQWQKQKYKKAWVSDEIIKLSKKQNRLYKIAVAAPNSANIEKYKKFRNYFTSVKRKAEKNYFQQKFEEAKSCSKQKWEIINGIMNRKQNNLEINKLKVDDKIIEDPEEISILFNENFINVTEKLLENQIVTEDKLKINSAICKSMYMNSTNEEEVTYIVQNLSNKKSTNMGDDSTRN